MLANAANRLSLAVVVFIETPPRFARCAQRVRFRRSQRFDAGTLAKGLDRARIWRRSPASDTIALGR